MLNKIPVLLVYSRVLLSGIILWLAFYYQHASIYWIAALIITGLITDIFDGIIARKLKVSTIQLRKLDSIIDRIFWCAVLASCYLLYPDFIISIIPIFGFIICLEILVFIISFVRFSQLPSPHNIISKVWGLSVAALFVEIVLTGTSGTGLVVMVILGIISRIDSMLIYLILKQWNHDIPSFYHANLLRHGKTFPKNDLFNG